MYDVIVLYYRRREPSKRDLRLFGGGLMLDLKRTTDEIRLGPRRLERARAMGTEDPGIQETASLAFEEAGWVCMKCQHARTRVCAI